MTDQLKAFIVNYNENGTRLGKVYYTKDLNLSEAKIREIFKKEINREILDIYTYIFTDPNVIGELC